MGSSRKQIQPSIKLTLSRHTVKSFVVQMATSEAEEWKISQTDWAWIRDQRYSTGTRNSYPYKHIIVSAIFHLCWQCVTLSPHVHWMFGKIAVQTSSNTSLMAGKMWMFPLASVGSAAKQGSPSLKSTWKVIKQMLKCLLKNSSKKSYYGELPFWERNNIKGWNREGKHAIFKLKKVKMFLLIQIWEKLHCQKPNMDKKLDPLRYVYEETFNK